MFIDFFTGQLAVFFLFIFILPVRFFVCIFWLSQAEMFSDLHKYNCYYVYRSRDCAISAQVAQLPRWATAARSHGSCKHRLFWFCLFVIASPGSRHPGLPIIDSSESDIWIFQGLVFCAYGCPMWPKGTNQEPAYFWMILEANHMRVIPSLRTLHLDTFFNLRASVNRWIKMKTHKCILLNTR